MPESVRSRGDDDEDDDANSTFCRASAGFALCHRPLHHRVTERFPMPKRSTLRLTKRIVDGLKPGGKDAIFWDRDLAGFGVRVHATGRKLYIVQSRGPAGLKRATLGPAGERTVEERRREAAAAIDRIKRGEDPKPPEPAPEPTVADLAELCLKNHVAARCKPATAKNYRMSIERHILPALGARR